MWVDKRGGQTLEFLGGVLGVMELGGGETKISNVGGGEVGDRNLSRKNGGTSRRRGGSSWGLLGESGEEKGVHEWTLKGNKRRRRKKAIPAAADSRMKMKNEERRRRPFRENRGKTEGKRLWEMKKWGSGCRLESNKAKALKRKGSGFQFFGG